MRTSYALAVFLLSGSASLHAQGFDYSHERSPELRNCDAHAHTGNRSEAELCYGSLLTSSQDARVRAEASWSLGDIRSANSYFQTAIEIYPEDAQARSRWGRLYLATHQESVAADLFGEALELDPDNVDAKLGMATVSAGRFEDRARELVAEVIEEAPRVDAYLMLASMSLEEGALEDADQELAAALELAQDEDQSPLEIYALYASSDLLRDVTDSEWTRRALDLNPSYGEIFATPAHFYIITRRYRQAIELLQRAVEVQPNLWSAHAELGVNLLRQNRVDEAQRHLAIAYGGDPFSAQTVNTLRVIDKFDRSFQVITRTQDAADAGPAMILRLHNEEAPVLESYVVDLVTRSIETFSERYDFELEEPVVVEIFDDHNDFSVRTSGLPGIGLLGVTFGYLVAMDSPSARTDGDYHWGTTLWHEMAHVFTLEATDHLVPRWFSEGVSVYEEWSTGPLPGRHIPLNVLQAMSEDKFLPVTDLDSGFIRPTYEGQIIVSYMQAGLLCQYIAQRWGQQALVSMLELYRAGMTTAEVVQPALGITPALLDRDFDEYLTGEFAATLDQLDTWEDRLGEASEAYAGEDWEEAVAAAAAAIESYPEHVEQSSAYLIKAQAHEELGQRELAAQALESYWRHGGHLPGAMRRLGDWLAEAGRMSEAVEVMSDALWVAPLDDGLHVALGDRLLGVQRPEEALREYEASLAMNPHDQAAAHYRLATAYRQLGDDDRTREHVLYALEIAPHYREAQQLLLEIAR